MRAAPEVPRSGELLEQVVWQRLARLVVPGEEVERGAVVAPAVHAQHAPVMRASKEPRIHQHLKQTLPVDMYRSHCT